MHSHTENSRLDLAAAAVATHGQVRSLYQQLSEAAPQRSLEPLRRTLSRVDESLEAALHADSLESLRMKGVEGAMDITNVLSAYRVAATSPAAYRASSRIAATLLLLSQLSSGHDDPSQTEALTLAVHTALQEIAAQRLLLELETPEPVQSRAQISLLAGAA